MLRIAIQTKGRLYEESIELLANVGIKFSSIGKRQLLMPAKNFPLEVLFLRDDDIPQTVQNGVADIGIVGENEYIEKEGTSDIVYRLGFSKCRISLAIPKDVTYKGINWFSGKKIATSYPNILRSYLKKNRIKADIYDISGSVEVTPEIGLSDAIFDIVSSGSTLVAHHLKEVETVFESEAVMIGNANLTPAKKILLEELIFRIKAVQEAENKKYVLMNVPNENLEEIITVLPGVKAPTIMPLVRDGWSSLHTVISEKQFWDIIAKLKQLGAEGILVLPIEKIVL